MAAPLGAWGVELNGALISDNPPFRFAEDGPDLFGWDNLRDSDVARPSGHGSISDSPDYLPSRVIDIELIIDADTQAAAELQWAAFAAAWAPSTSEQQLSISTETQRYTRFGRPRRCQPKSDGFKHIRSDYVIEAVCRFEATDPLLYGDPQVSQGTTGEVIGGFTFPHGFPQGFGVASVGGVVLNNLGNYASRRLTVVIEANAGDVDQPELELLTTGETLDFNLVIPDGDSLTIDFYNKRATLNGESRTGALRFPQSRWPEIPPGTHTMRFSTSGAEALLTATFLPAFIL